jgi:hypothetical protein
MLKAILVLSLAFGGIAYFVFACVLFYWFGKLSSSKNMIKLSLLAPILFIPFQALFWLSKYYIDKLSNPDLVGGWEGLLAFAVYILIVGYCYVAIVNVGYLVLNKIGWVNEKPLAS